MTTGYDAYALEAAAMVAQSHAPDRKRPLGSYDPEDREIIRAEENGEKIAAQVIAQRIRALPVATPADLTDEDRALIDRLIAKAWRWGHGCADDDIADRRTVGDSYNEGCRAETDDATQAIGALIADLRLRLSMVSESRAKTRLALEKMREKINSQSVE